MNRLNKPKKPSPSRIKLSLKLPTRDDINSFDDLKAYTKKNAKLSLVNKFNTPDELENYVKNRKTNKRKSIWLVKELNDLESLTRHPVFDIKKLWDKLIFLTVKICDNKNYLYYGEIKERIFNLAKRILRD